MNVCVWMHIDFREMTAGEFFPLVKSYYTRWDCFGSLSCFINSERLLWTAPTPKLFLQAMVLAQLPLIDYSCVLALRILVRDKQWDEDHACFQTVIFGFDIHVSTSGKCFFLDVASAMWGFGCLHIFWMPLHKSCEGLWKPYGSFLSISIMKTTDLSTLKSKWQHFKSWSY